MMMMMNLLTYLLTYWQRYVCLFTWPAYRVEKIRCVTWHHNTITPAGASRRHVRRPIFGIFTERITTNRWWQHSLNNYFPGQPGKLVAGCLSVHFNAHFPDGSVPSVPVPERLHSGFIGAKDDGGGGNNWSYKTCKAPYRHHQQTNTQFFYRPDALPIAQPTVSEHLTKTVPKCTNCHHHFQHP